MPTMPITRHMLKILLPTTFPTEMSLCPFAAATADVASSGRDVPRATIEIPINISDNPIVFAIIIAFWTTRFAPKVSENIPAITRKKLKQSFLKDLSGSILLISLFFAFFMLIKRKQKRKNNNIIPSKYPISKSKHNIQKRDDINIMKGKSKLIICLLISTFRIIALMPITRAILITLLPSIFPTEISPEPLSAATKLTRSSGADVARETIVSPIITGLTENIRAVDDDPFTRNSDPIYKSTRPRIRVII